PTDSGLFRPCPVEHRPGIHVREPARIRAHRADGVRQAPEPPANPFVVVAAPRVPRDTPPRRRAGTRGGPVPTVVRHRHRDYGPRSLENGAGVGAALRVPRDPAHRAVPARSKPRSKPLCVARLAGPGEADRVEAEGPRLVPDAPLQSMRRIRSRPRGARIDPGAEFTRGSRCASIPM